MSDQKAPSTKFETGRAVRASVLGEAHVARAENGSDPFDQPFQELISEGAWGTVWAGKQWSMRERSMVTIALLAALGHHEEVAMHIRAAQNTGASREDIREALMHVAIYAGVPAANSAIKIAKQVFEQIDKKRGDNGAHDEL